MKRCRLILSLIALSIGLAAGWQAEGQRRINPVENPAIKPKPVNLNPISADSLARRNVVEMLDDKGNKILVDTVAGTEWVDSVPANLPIPKMIYPLLYDYTVSVDLAGPLMRAFGRHYGLGEVAAMVNLHNRYIPVVEVGLGQASYTPEGNNYSYHSPVSPYFRIGMNYNFLYNSNPDYQFFAGIRYGLSPFRWSVDDVTPVGGDYWGAQEPFTIGPISSTAGYLQVLAGLNVRIVAGLSLGWTFRYQAIIHQSASVNGEPYYIPGFGSRNTPISFTFSVSYTLPFSHKSDSKATTVAPESQHPHSEHDSL
ncbi:MAG: hypothetical protein K2H61_04050 [Muribaculaceae bacterium]|nr:hypothetical protein [Muribaculaceae bacterium]